MVAQIKSNLEKINKTYPDWINQLEKNPETWREDQTENGEKWRKDFLQIINNVCAAIKNGELKKDSALELFAAELRGPMDNFLSTALRPFFAFEKVRELDKESLSQIRYVLDAIWEQYVIRFNPELKIDPVENFTEDEIAEMGCALEALAFYCVTKTFSYEGIVTLLKYQLVLPDELIEYIAKRIDRDYRELQINFIVKKLDEASEN